MHPKPGDKPAEISRLQRRARPAAGAARDGGEADAEREQWRRQQIDIIAEATQVDTYPNGLEELARIEETIRKDKQSSLLPHIVFRRVLAGYFVDLDKAEAADRQKVQDGFLKELEQFVTDYPQAEQVPDAMYQLATALDLNGKPTEASIWYGRLMKSYATTEVGERAIGSLRRLQLKGKPLVLAGKGLNGQQINVAEFQGKVLVVVYWATWCKPCTEDLPALKELYAADKAQGMEVLGVNVDTPDGPIKEYLTEYKVPWPHIAELKGMDCPQAINYGILSVPTMFVVDRTGVCQSVTASLDDLKKVLPELLKK
ncbi:MAG: redoxin domain-containing protein [Rubrivivax sp.]